jgi:hypothetical protein
MSERLRQLPETHAPDEEQQSRIRSTNSRQVLLSV